MSSAPGSSVRPEIRASDWPSYRLLDSGDGRKLEAFGNVRVIRHEPKAWWRPGSSREEWGSADAVYQPDGTWKFPRRPPPRFWTLPWNELTLEVRLADTSRHLGVFPEQDPHWRLIRRRLRAESGVAPRVLNLFGYTGVASLVAAQTGCAVTHVDASRPALNWARRNQSLSELTSAPIRWIHEDAFTFVRREERRGNNYDAILLDPPSFGRGPKKEVWKVEEQVASLLRSCRQLLSDRPKLVLLTLYNLEASALMLRNLLEDVFSGLNGRLNCGELVLQHAFSDKLLPLSLFCSWESETGL